jgi:hypothetical protein
MAEMAGVLMGFVVSLQRLLGIANPQLPEFSGSRVHTNRLLQSLGSQLQHFEQEEDLLNFAKTLADLVAKAPVPEVYNFREVDILLNTMQSSAVNLRLDGVRVVLKTDCKMAADFVDPRKDPVTGKRLGRLYGEEERHLALVNERKRIAAEMDEITLDTPAKKLHIPRIRPAQHPHSALGARVGMLIAQLETLGATVEVELFNSHCKLRRAIDDSKRMGRTQADAVTEHFMQSLVDMLAKDARFLYNPNQL